MPAALVLRTRRHALARSEELVSCHLDASHVLCHLQCTHLLPRRCTTGGLCCQGRQLGMRLSVLRLEFNHRRERSLRLHQPPEPTQRLSLAVVRLGRIIRRERKGSFRMRQRLGMPPVAVGTRGRIK